MSIFLNNHKHEKAYFSHDLRNTTS